MKTNTKEILSFTLSKNNLALLIYRELDGMKQTKAVIQMKEQIKTMLYQELRNSFLDLSGIGSVIGYEELQGDLRKAVEFLEAERNAKCGPDSYRESKTAE